MKPSIVFLSPTIPSFSGNGLAMRAAHNLRALSEKFYVHLLVVAIYGGHHEQPSDAVLLCCASWKRIDASLPLKINSGWSLQNSLQWGTGRLPAEWNGWKGSHEKELEAYFQETRCVRLWVFRFYLLPWARKWLDQGGQAWIDLDELESSARERQAELLFKTGQREAADRLKNEAGIYRNLEKRFLARFQRVVTASDFESSRLSSEMRLSSVETWPNIVVAPAADVEHPTTKHEEWKLLFIGSLGHFPNRDAVRCAAEQVVPRLEKVSEIPVILTVAGAGADAHRDAFADLKQIEWLGTVPEVGTAYVQADIVVVPLRAGGGTRIKILEAFAYRKAVVSTSVGAEGLDVVHDRELVLADTPDELAVACAEVLKNEEKRKRLAAAGYAYVTTHHAPDNLRVKLERLLRDLSPVSGMLPNRE
jgi:glycosyltransferase involved in cell wall biosynthesis